MSDLSDLLRGTANFIDAVTDAYREQRTGFSDRESGDYLDTAGLDDAVVSEDDEDQVMRLALKLYRVRQLAKGWRYKGEFGWGPWQEGHGPDPEGLVLDQVATELLAILNEGINFWTPPESEADDVVDAEVEVHCEGCKCPSICGCGREIYSEPESPDGPLFWFHSDDHSPITLDCARIRDGEAAPGEDDDLASPSPGDTADHTPVELITAAMNQLALTTDVHRLDYVLELIRELRALAAQLEAKQLSVGHADLAAHVMAIQLSCLRRGATVDGTYDEIASDLLSDYRITKK